ncbi:MAG: phosphate acetyltransferase [Candidatus Omnitrophota bacterium]|nr:phosphate acetyltransferase [Candidatus Omnitrophota bacterium]
MSLIDDIRNRAIKADKKIVLPESDDPRTIEALDYILDKKIAKIILVGKDDLRRAIKSKNLRGMLELIDPEKYKDIDEMASVYYELRKAKGMTPEEAKETVRKDYLIFGGMLVRQGLADGFVAGANHTTPDVIRAALRCLPIDKNIGVVSGAFLMVVPDSPYGDKGAFIFADCGVNPEPSAKQLAGIAVCSADLFKKLTGGTPRVAFLSYSSKGSAGGPLVEKVKEAVAKAKESLPGLFVDGEFQVDSAIVPEVARRKCAEGEVAGKANVLIFPDLNSGNISYKLTQRLANARAVGPHLMGFIKPASDVSRGCYAEDIVDAVAITAIRAFPRP